MKRVSTQQTFDPQSQHTDIQQDSSILLLVHNMGIHDLIIQGLGLLISGRHDGREGRRAAAEIG